MKHPTGMHQMKRTIPVTGNRPGSTATLHAKHLELSNKIWNKMNTRSIIGWSNIPDDVPTNKQININRKQHLW